ncbi:MAG: hypothetical protein WDA00_07835 [Eubacteriales bacterium]
MLWLLAKIRLQGMFLSAFKGSKKRRERPSPLMLVLIGLLVLYVVGAMVGMVVMMAWLMCPPLAEMGLGWLYFAYFAIMAFAVSLIAGVFMAKSQLFEAKDNEQLLSLPLPPRVILLSRMLSLYLFDLLFFLFILVPVYVVWLIVGTFSPLGLCLFVPGLLLFPLLSLAASALLGWLLAMATARIRYKNLLSLLLAIPLTLGALYANLMMYQWIGALAASGAEIAGVVRRVMYLFYCFGKVAAEGAALPFLLFAAGTVLPFALCLLVLDRTFLRVLTTKYAGKKAVYTERATAARAPLSAFTRKELRRFFSSAGYMLNAGIGLIFVLVGAVALLVKGPELIGLLAEAGLGAFAGGQMLGAVVVGALCALGGMTFISAPAVSLEGSSLWIPCSLPVHGRVPLHAKTLAHLTICLPVNLFASLCAIVALRLPPLMALFVVVLPALFSVFCGLTGTIANVYFPKLDWMDETVAVKQSMSVLLAMLAATGLLIALGAFCVLLTPLLPMELLLGVCTVVLAALDYLLYRHEDRGAAARFSALPSRQ